MAKGFFRELKCYTLSEITKEIGTTIEETKRLVGILKRYGIVKAVKASKPEYEELSNQDIVLTDVSENSSNVEYVFEFVGVVMLDEHIFKCYPKYIHSTYEPMQQLKKVLKVIKKYNDKEQLIYLYNGEEDDKIFNRLAVSLHLLEDYFQYGIYTNQQVIIENNGEGEILWDKTINETFALVQNNRPYYLELQTKNTIDNEMDYFRRLHECVVSLCSAELKKMEY
ncbi:MAG: LlaJI family restriction endonuclease [Lachnospiraceae bacterium]|nr:LlaJI family restriction endonuclease [Lachnospiraceae bacterium]